MVRKDDDRAGTTEYTNEYYRTSGGQWVHLNTTGPTHNADDADFARRGWDFVDAASVPGTYNGAHMPSVQAGQGDQTGALKLLFEFLTGTGPADREFGPSDYMTQGMMTSPDVAAARQKFIDQAIDEFCEALERIQVDAKLLNAILELKRRPQT